MIVPAPTSRHAMHRREPALPGPEDHDGVAGPRVRHLDRPAETRAERVEHHARCCARQRWVDAVQDASSARGTCTARSRPTARAVRRAGCTNRSAACRTGDSCRTGTARSAGTTASSRPPRDRRRRRPSARAARSPIWRSAERFVPGHHRHRRAQLALELFVVASRRCRRLRGEGSRSRRRCPESARRVVRACGPRSAPS